MSAELTPVKFTKLDQSVTIEFGDYKKRIDPIDLLPDAELRNRARERGIADLESNYSPDVLAYVLRSNLAGIDPNEEIKAKLQRNQCETASAMILRVLVLMFSLFVMLFVAFLLGYFACYTF